MQPGLVVLPFRVKSSLFRIFGHAFWFYPDELLLDCFAADGATFTNPVSVYLGWNFTKCIDVRISLSLRKLSR